MKSGIYKITNVITEKIYIGSAVDLRQRKSAHFSQLLKKKHHSIKLQNSVNKHLIENFIFTVIEYVEDLDTLLDREQYYLNLLLKANEDSNYFDLHGYNMLRTAHNSKGYKFTEARLENISRSQINHTANKEICLKIENIGDSDIEKYEYKKKETKDLLTDKSREKLSTNLKKLRTENPDVFATCMKGKNHSDEAKKKIGFANRMKNPKKLLQYDIDNNLIKIWETHYDCADFLGINKNNILRCCRGEKRTYLGFRWKFAD